MYWYHCMQLCMIHSIPNTIRVTLTTGSPSLFSKKWIAKTFDISTAIDNQEIASNDDHHDHHNHHDHRDDHDVRMTVTTMISILNKIHFKTTQFLELLPLEWSIKASQQSFANYTLPLFFIFYYSVLTYGINQKDVPNIEFVVKLAQEMISVTHIRFREPW